MFHRILLSWGLRVSAAADLCNAKVPDKWLTLLPLASVYERGLLESWLRLQTMLHLCWLSLPIHNQSNYCGFVSLSSHFEHCKLLRHFFSVCASMRIRNSLLQGSYSFAKDLGFFLMEDTLKIFTSVFNLETSHGLRQVEYVHTWISSLGTKFLGLDHNNLQTCQHFCEVCDIKLVFNVTPFAPD